MMAASDPKVTAAKSRLDPGAGEPSTGYISALDLKASFDDLQDAWQADDAALPAPVVDHGALTGLGDDDHPQYLTEARGDARYINSSGDTMTGRFTAGELEVLNVRNDGVLLFPWGDASAQCAIYPVVNGVNGNGMVYYGGLWHIPAVADPVVDGDAANKAYVDGRIWSGTQAAYDALGTYDSDVLYVIV